MSGQKKLRIGILFGGRSGEHEVSLVSAASVIRALDPAKYEAVPIGITKEGQWLVGTGAQNMLPDVLKRGQRVMLPGDPTSGALVHMGPTDSRPNLKVDVVFPVLHGTFGEDGTVQGLLELAGLPYVGAGVLASAVGMDKDVQKRLFEHAKIPIVPYVAFARTQWEQDRKGTLASVQKKLRYPMFVKPATLGSSVGMTRVAKAAELPAAIDTAAEFALKILVEKAVSAREIEVSVLGNENPEASIPGEIVPHREFYDYTAKYLEGGSRIEIPAKLTKTQAKKIQRLRRASLSIHRLHWHGAGGFLLGEKIRAHLRQRTQYHSRLHLHQHVPENVGSLRPELHKANRQAHPIGAGSSRAKSPHKIFHRTTSGSRRRLRSLTCG